jgi:hypothetical protein
VSASSLLSVATSAAIPWPGPRRALPSLSSLRCNICCNTQALSTSSVPFPFLSLLQHPGQGPVKRSLPSLLSVATSAATLRPCRRQALPSLFCLCCNICCNTLLPSLLSVATTAATLRPCRRRALPSLFCLCCTTRARALSSIPFPLFSPLQHLLQHSGPVNVERSLPFFCLCCNTRARALSSAPFPLFSPLQHLLQHSGPVDVERSLPFFVSLLQHPGQGPVECSLPSLRCNTRVE